MRVERDAARRGNCTLVAQRRELDQPDAVGEISLDRLRQAVYEAGLPDAPGPEERQDAGRFEQPGRELEVALAADERSRLGRNTATRIGPRASGSVIARGSGRRRL